MTAHAAPTPAEAREEFRNGTVAVHGAPVHIGAPEALGITDLARPDFGDTVDVRDGDVPVFWACGVTPQAVVMASKPDFAITHAPGHMFITDVPDATHRIEA